MRQAERENLAELSVIETRILAALAQAKKILPHPVAGIVVATLIAFSGRGELVLRSYGLLAIVIWLNVDLWAWLLPMRCSLKHAIGATSSSLMLIAMMGVMWWWMDGKLQDQQEDVFDHLGIQFEMTPTLGANAVMKSNVTIVNGGHFDVGKFEILCHAVLIEWEDGSKLKNGTLGYASSQTVFRAGGDGATVNCMGLIRVSANLSNGMPRKFVCGDVLVDVKYTLATQPLAEQQKRARFVSRENTQFNWKSEPVDSRESFCPDLK
jgi:hypothetical protein